ncbi:MAG: hypothetical protein QRY74_05335 [Chlamydia sp.]
MISHEPQGSVLQFIRAKKGGKFVPKLYGTGFTHISSIAAPERVSPYSTNIIWKEKEKRVEMRFNDGTHRVYELYRVKDAKKKKCLIRHYFRIREMRLPSGTMRYFCYKNGNLSSIHTEFFGVKIGEFFFNKKKNSGWHVTMSDGRSVAFDGTSIKGGRVLSHIRPGCGESLSFIYSKSGKKHEARVQEKVYSGGKRVKAEFFADYEKKQNSKIQRFLRSRVRQLSALRLPGQTAYEVTHTIEYKKHANDEREAIVYEADGYSTSYLWSEKHRRIRWVHRKNNRGERISSERFVWSVTKEMKGRLLRRILFDERLSPILMKEWIYNSAGLVECEQTRGYFFEKASIENPLVLDKKSYQWQSGGDLLEKKAWYDSYGRKTKEIGPDGCGIEYVYQFDDHRTILRAQYRVTPEGNITQRSGIAMARGL